MNRPVDRRNSLPNTYSFVRGACACSSLSPSARWTLERTIFARMTPEQAAIDGPFTGSQSEGSTRSSEPPPVGLLLAGLLFSPLPFATVALLLSIFDNPVARGLTASLMVWTAIPIGMRAWRTWEYRRRLNIDFLDALAVGVLDCARRSARGRDGRVFGDPWRSHPRSNSGSLAARGSEPGWGRNWQSVDPAQRRG
jgi:hypothetical protein